MTRRLKLALTVTSLTIFHIATTSFLVNYNIHRSDRGCQWEMQKFTLDEYNLSILSLSKGAGRYSPIVNSYMGNVENIIPNLPFPSLKL